jgi:WD40 repeat protein
MREDGCLTSWPAQGVTFDILCTPDGRHVVTAGGDGDHAIRVRDATTGETVDTLRGHEDVVSSLALAPGSDRLISTGYDATIRLWRLRGAPAGPEWTARPSRDKVNSVTWSPGGATFASAGNDGTVRLHDATGGGVLRSFDLRCQRVPSLRYSPDGRWLAAATIAPDAVVLLDPATGTRHELAGHEQAVRTVRFAPDGSILASAGDDLVIRLWSMRSGKSSGRAPAAPLAELTGHQQDIFALAFSPDGSLLASAGRGGDIRLWSPRTARCLLTLPGHHDMIFNMAFSPDGKRLFSASRDHTIGVWDLSYYDHHIEGNRTYQERRRADDRKP